MRSGAAAGTEGYFHETAFYGSDEELLAIVVPFLRDGVAAGEPTLVTFAERNAALVRSALGDTTGVEFVTGELQYAKAASAIRSYRELLAEHTARGVGQIRVVGDVPHPGFGVPWDAWARYEAAVNHAYDDFPIWGMCPYDTRTTPPDVLADVTRTHPRIATADGGHHMNPEFGDPVGFLESKLITAVRPESGPPALDLAGPAPALARAAVRDVASATLRDPDDLDDLVLAASEAVTNAISHGKPPVRLRVWTDGGRVVVAVTDAGPGPSDPYAGLLPALDSETGGLGLWMAHQICSDVTFHRDTDGFTIRLVVAAS
ncbi:anti-sigma factor RsbA family regulatory protein [Pseudonocardia nigra]|uniref:anti-sigma factor RsbA family regulatory protein n=1 Tax=Pseudonocardia nigra TaxID=1921578 RepID=UPI001C5CD532|nr:anti-sigma factor RsbA family regulatory protein [Pseudonocardia nigra]